MKKWLSGALVAASLAVVPNGASAQTEAEFIAAFAGEWQAIDARHSSGGTCTLTLSSQGGDGRYEMTNSNCGNALENVTSWSILDSQMVLRDDTSTIVALGGNQRRMSGSTEDGSPIVLDRVQPAGTIDPLRAALQVSGCYFSGFTSTCASPDQLKSPTAMEEADDGRVKLLVNLNVRSEARDDASVIGIVPAESCIATNLCLEASDGAWCRASFGERDGWIRKQALRQNRWPVITFENGCGRGNS